MVTIAELDENQIPLKLRDDCSNLLLKFNRCLRKNYFLPWSCKEERTLYKECYVRQQFNKLHLIRLI